MTEQPTTEPVRRESERLDEEAARWSERLRSSDSSSVRAAFDRWLGDDPARQAAFDRAERARNIAQALADAPELTALRTETQRRLAAPSRPPLWRAAFARPAMAIAASLAVMAIGVGAWWTLRGDAPPNDAPSMVAQAPEDGHLYQTAVGQRLVVTLDDSSVLTLDTASRASVDYSASQRQVRLLAGQAFFKVAHDPERPFVVVAGDKRVIALGTEFDVRLSGDGLAVTLVTGRVRVEPISAAGAETKPLAVLSPGQQFVATAGETRVLAGVDVGRATAWRLGQLIFENETLGEAVSEMNRYGRRRIVLRDRELARLAISGAFETGQSETFVEALTEYFPIEVAAETEREIVLARRD